MCSGYLGDVNPSIYDPLRYVYISFWKKCRRCTVHWKGRLGFCRQLEHANENPTTQVCMRPPRHHWLAYMSSYVSLPSIIPQLSSFNHDLPEHLSRNWIFQTVDHSEKACSPFANINSSSAYYQWNYSPLFFTTISVFHKNSLIYPIF